VARELIADIVFLPLAIVAVVSGLVLLHHATSL
jgi:hypothetical protein